MDFKKNEWDVSYKNKDNYVFYPHEEVIRFVSKYVRKRTGINDYIKISSMDTGLDLGCGIGRHVIYMDEMGFEAHGIDLSSDAVEFGRKWCRETGKSHLTEKLVVGSITEMPYKDSFFDFIISHGVLDSMSYSVAKEAMPEIARVTKPGGLFYFDVVSGDDKMHPREYNDEEIVQTAHENGTVQSYFNWSKVIDLMGGLFIIEEAFLVQRESVVKHQKNSRYHIIARKNS